MPVIKSIERPASLPFSMADIEHEAAALLEEARRRSVSIVEQARNEAAEMRQAGYDEGLEQGRRTGQEEGLIQGREEGRQQAIEEHREALEGLSQALEGVLHAFDVEREALVARAASEVPRLAIAIADRVCKRSTAADPAICQANVNAALRLVMKARDVRLHVNPADAVAIRDLLPGIGRQWPSLAHIELVETGDIARGGCRVVTEGGLIDADLNTQLERISADLVPGQEARRSDLS